MQYVGDVREGGAGHEQNSVKFQFGQDTVEFARIQVTKTGIRPATEYLRSIEAFLIPTNISEVHHGQSGELCLRHE